MQRLPFKILVTGQQMNSRFLAVQPGLGRLLLARAARIFLLFEALKREGGRRKSLEALASGQVAQSCLFCS